MEINLPDDQRTAVAAIDTRKLDELLDQAIQEERSRNLHSLHLTGCGTYIATRFHSFQQALLKHREARSPRKRTETSNYLESARRDLVFAVQSMQHRVEGEKKDEQYFHVRGEFAPPYSFGNRLSARVSYRWRKTVDEPRAGEHRATSEGRMCKNGTIRGGRCDVKQPHERRFKLPASLRQVPG